MPKSPVVEQGCPSDVEELGVFVAMALLSTLQAGADTGFRRVSPYPGLGPRLAPHRALRHRLLLTLLRAGVLEPVRSRGRCDNAATDATWADVSFEDADWYIVWDELTRSSLPLRLRAYLDTFASTPRTREVLGDTWQALGVAECLAFGEYALSSHNLNPSLATAAAAVLPPILAQQSIGQGCALMWSAAKNVAAWFLRHGGSGQAAAEREFARSMHTMCDRAGLDRPIAMFSRHVAIPLSTFATNFVWTSRLGDAYWTSPVSESVLEHARPHAD